MRQRSKGVLCDYCGHEISEEHSIVQRVFDDIGVLTFHWDCLWAIAKRWKQVG